MNKIYLIPFFNNKFLIYTIYFFFIFFVITVSPSLLNEIQPDSQFYIDASPFRPILYHLILNICKFTGIDIFLFQELTLSLKRQPKNNICYEQCLFLYDLLILIFPNKHRFILSVFNEYPVIGIKKNHEHLSFVFNTDVANHVNKLNALNIPTNYL